MQKLLTFIIGCSILYLIFEKNNESNKVPVFSGATKTEEHSNNNNNSEQPEFTGNFFEKTISNIITNTLKTTEGKQFVSNLIQPINKSISMSDESFQTNNESFLNSIFEINTFGEGESEPVICGQTITADYTIFNEYNETREMNSKSFTLGSSQAAIGMDGIIVGMKVGQTRHATINSSLFPNSMTDQIKYFKINVKLKSIDDQISIGNNVKIFDDNIAYNAPLTCGNQAVFDAKITRLSNGEILYNSEDTKNKIAMRIGDNSYPIIFSYALHGKIPLGSRTVISQGKFFKSYKSDYSKIFDKTILPDNEYFMIEFFNFQGKKLPVQNMLSDKKISH